MKNKSLIDYDCIDNLFFVLMKLDLMSYDGMDVISYMSVMDKYKVTRA